MDDNELRQAMAVIEAYTAQIEALNRQVRLLQISLDDTNRARDSFRALADAKEGDEILVPVGVSSFVPMKVTGKKTALVGIGNRLATEKDLEEAAKYMEAYGNEVSKALRDAVSTLDEIEKVTTELTAAVQNEYQDRQLLQQ
jgi:prefoldin alpha subunit